MQTCKKHVLKTEVHAWGVYRPACGCQTCEMKAIEYAIEFKKLLNHFKMTIAERKQIREGS
ncbi:hypothetical protein [Alkalihalobacillus pseudalcaliphilus]|uniref:hypothetical protein n=1 Tax=Alkalihalobacillus pseudalcaliphilus TaxID=79884 RepID=UPI00064DA6AA|nr:hypothetical protein [Alkalihalobacillus pseudalcaliphilus]KMK77608.1 hypothetical protein AB990_03860 [Alkalihalobacillus pseudalcaliphilus]